MRKGYIWILVFCLALIGCSSNQEKAGEKKTKDEIVLALTNEPESGFDPILGYGSYGSPLIQSTLLSFDQDLNVTYDLAEEYQVSDDKLTWEFKLRDDAVFTDGKKVTAHDVAFTYMAAKESGSTVDLNDLKEAKAIDEFTVHFILEKPLSTFVYSAASIGIVPKHTYSKSYASEPIGSGPYKLVQWNKGQQAIFTRNEDYYGKKPNFKKVTVLFMSEDAAFAAAKSGKVDVAQTSSAYATEDINQMKVESFESVDNRGIAFVTIRSGQTVNGKPAGNDVTSDLAIRKAINLAIDREALVKDALNGYGKPAYSNADDLPWGSKKAIVERNVDKAKEILKVGGWKDTNGDGVIEKKGVEAKFNLLYTAGDSARQAITMSIQQQLNELGIQVTVKGGSWDDIEKSMYQDAVLFGWGSRNPIELYHLYHSSNIGFDYYNTNSYANKQVDQYLENALVSGDYQDWKKAQEPIVKDTPWAWLVNVDHLYFVNDNLDMGKQPIHPHDHALIVMNNIQDWKWKD